MSDNSFFEELQNDFLNEVAFLLETYEEHMLGLENDADKAGHLTQIFRVAHSIKGGAAAVGFQDFSHFAHIVEDLLSILRTAPEFVNSDIISILLISGDQFKLRVKMLQEKDNSAWDVSDLEKRIEQTIQSLTGKNNAELVKPAALPEAINSESESSSAPQNAAADLIPFDSNEKTVQSQEPTAEVDHTNYDLLNELLAELPEDVVKEYQQQESKVEAIQNPLATQVSPKPAEAMEAKVNSSEKNVIPLVPVQAKNTTVKEVKEPTKESNTESKKNTVHKTHTNQIIKVDTARVDNVLDAVGELVVLKNQIVHNEFIKNGNNPQLAAIVDQLDKGVRELYDKTLSIRMTPLKSLYIKIQRIVRDVSISLDKPVNLELIGEETEVERTVFELLNDPLVHLVRNAMDHGVEKRDIRKQKGKPEVAKVVVSSKQMGGNVIIDIVDDGGGINREKILQKAFEKNLIPESVNPDSLTDEEVFKFIFAPGFSTAEKISDLSGRGVGLDVVRSNIEKVNGKINIFSKIGLGSTFRLTIPLSTAITDGIVVSMNKQRFIMPIYAIKEIIRLKKDLLTEIPGQGFVAKVRESLLPVADLSNLFHEIDNLIDKSNTDNATVTNDSISSQSRKRADEIMLIIVESGGHSFSIPVDDVLGQTQVVVKSLSVGANVPEVSGAAILGDGKTVLILDPNSMVKGMKSEAAA